jgi:uncharacterized protein YjdB
MCSVSCLLTTLQGRIAAPRTAAFFAWLASAVVLIGGSTIVACGDSVTQPSATVTSIEVTPTTATLVSFGEAAQLSAAAHDADGRTVAGISFTWSSSDEHCATVNPAGLVTAAGNGAVTVTAAYKGVSGTASVTIAQAVAAVVVTPLSTTLTSIDETAQLTASARDANTHPIAGATFTWESSDGNVVTVSTNGLVTAVENGTATITATTDGFSGDADVTVAQEVAAVSVTPKDVRFTALEEKQQLTAGAEDANRHAVAGKTFTWSSSDESVATVDSDGLATAEKNGTVTITATTDGVGGDAEVTVAQEAATVTVAPTAVAFTSLDETAQLDATARDDRGNEIVTISFTWESSDQDVATVSDAGLVKAKGNGTAMVTATADGVADTVDVTVAQEVVAVSVTPEATSLAALGETAQLAASAQDANDYEVAGKTFTWQSSNQNIATVSSTGLATAEANGTATVTATTDGVGGDAEVTVAQKADSVELSPIGAAISGTGTTQQFTAEAWDARGNPILDQWVNSSWTSLNSNIATVDPSTGVAAAAGIGQVTIQVDVDGVVEYALLTVTMPGLSRVNLWAEMNTGLKTTLPLEDLRGTSASDVFAVGDGGRVLHYDGTTWSTSFSSLDFLHMDVWGSTEHDVYVVGHAAKVLHYDGTFWSLVTSGMSDMLSAVWGASPDDVFAVSWDGTIVHFDGAGWSAMDSDNTLGLHHVWGISASDVYAVGADRVLHYDGASWTWTEPGPGRNIESVWGASETDIYAAGVGGDVFHYDGNNWTHVAWGAPIIINDIWGSSNTDMYFAGADTAGNAAIFHNDGTNVWTLVRSPAVPGLNGIWGAPTGEVFVTGSAGTILRGYRGGTVTVTPSNASITGASNQVRLTAEAHAGGSPVAAVPYSWSSDDEGVATVDPQGLVTGVANGTTSIRAVAFGGSSATATVTVSLTQQPPSAVIDSPANDTTLTLGETMNFQGTASDPDGTIASHEWDFGDGNGASVEDPGIHTYGDVGTYTVTYRVTDDDGASSPTALVVITVVLNQEPVATITSPTDAASFAVGETITFAGSGSDHEDGDLTGASLIWTSSLHGQIGTGTSFTRGDLSSGTHHITLTASDSEDATATTGVSITVQETEPIVTGGWHTDTEFGSVDFTVDPQGTAITFFRFSFSDYACGPISGSWIVEISGGTWTISDRQFSLDHTAGLNRYVFAGTFDDSGTQASGTWDITLSGTTCSGSWQGVPQ